jgi:hypothetical protein
VPIPMSPVSLSTVRFVCELRKILGSTGNVADEDDDTHEYDKDAQLVAVLVSSSGQYQGDENLESQGSSSCHALPCKFHGSSSWRLKSPTLYGSIPWSHSCALLASVVYS